MNPRKTTPMVAETLTLAQLALLLALPLILVVPTWGDDSDSNVSASLPQGVQDVEEARIAAIERAVPASIGVFGPGASGGGSGVVISADGVKWSTKSSKYRAIWK